MFPHADPPVRGIKASSYIAEILLTYNVVHKMVFKSNFPDIEGMLASVRARFYSRVAN